jgi:hypothetical protein
MSETAQLERSFVPQPLRFAGSLRLSPAWIGLLLAAALLGGFLLLECALGRLEALLAPDAPPELGEDFRVSLVMLVLAAYLPAAQMAGLRASRRAVDELRPLLRCSAGEFAVLRGEMGSVHRLGYYCTAIAGPLIGILALVAVEPDWGDYGLLRYSPEAISHRILGPILGLLAGTLIHSRISDSRRLSRLGRERVEVDLLDPRSLAPFARLGLQNVLIFVGVISITLLFLADLGAAPGLVGVLVFLLLLMMATAMISMVLPTLGIRQRIREAKREALDECRERIRRARDAWKESGGEAAGEGTGMADLLAYRSLIESVPEWPFNAPLLTRLLLYLAIPLGSWVAGAMVERGLDRLLD